VCVTLKEEKRSISEKKHPERVAAVSKQSQNEIPRREYFVTATTRSGMWRNAMMQNSCRGCFDIATTPSGCCWKKVSVNEKFTSSVMY
jgi:hypothetical protein